MRMLDTATMRSLSRTQILQVQMVNYSSLHCRLHMESVRTMFGFVCSSQIVTHQDQIWVHWEFCISQTQLSWCFRYWIRCMCRLSFGMMSNISQCRRFQAFLDVVSGQHLVSGCYGTTNTNMISKLHCAGGNAKHCKPVGWNGCTWQARYRQ